MISLLAELEMILLGVFYKDVTPDGVGIGICFGQFGKSGDREELASQARHWMDAPIRIVRLRETWSGACSDAIFENSSD
jgi:hypothetical protein